MSAPDPDAVLAGLVADPGRVAPFPALLRLARRVPAAQKALAPVLSDPLDRALLGVGPAPSEEALDRAVLAAVSVVEGGGVIDAQDAESLEARARADEAWWPLAAQVHAACSPERERLARRRLSDQELPYVFPGELHEIVVDLLAAGPRVMPALHVDWARKLVDLAADTLVLDCRVRGLWFFPVLRSLPTDRLVKPVGALARARRLPPGGLGLAAAYAFRVGAPWAPILERGDEVDAIVACLAIIGDRPA